jgi:hypothetical protein
MKKLFLDVTHAGETPRIHLPGTTQQPVVAEAAD